MENFSSKVFEENGVTMAQKTTTALYCHSCGAYLGEAVPGYLKAAICFCGELVAVTPVILSDTDEELVPELKTAVA